MKNVKENASTSIRFSEFSMETFIRHPLLASEFAYEIYSVLFLFLLIRRYWVLHGITLVILAHIADIVFSWFVHVKEAREIRLFKSWLVWWMRIGLDFATNTIEGDVIHRVLVANSLNFWNMMGKKYTFNWFNQIIDDGRAKILTRRKEQLEQLTKNHSNFVRSVGETFMAHTTSG